MLSLSLDPKSPLPIHRQIYDQIRLAITNGSLAAGEKLPTQGEFRNRWDIHIETVIRAMRALERDGLIESRGNLGRFVTETPPSISRSERTRQLKEQTRSYLAGLAPFHVTMAEVVKAIHDHWKGTRTK